MGGEVMSLTNKEVQHVARLARLAILPPEIAEATGTLGRVLDYINLLNELDTEHVLPTTHVVPLLTTWREDRVEPSLPPQVAVQNGPEVLSQMFVVPKILDGGAG